ncbi:FecR domain-containing protein [Aliifodinibius sp. S!AR15-10]|uniref:FecR family protein n=1 Tax=Aliifodinibius sp. S!AR15-10 TaxID=2950437 RepID=UPI0028551699|nr:FecR domain-containing protein [Aliifodinibius sp. S!AR15-10]MDR8393345.1 FecR domain-containing protein [Aliifodinibius sp. S!AR15-10]
MNWKILYNYIEGKCDEEELRQLGVWLNKNQANEDFFISFVEEWGEKEAIEFDTDARAEWDKFREKNLETDSGNESGGDSSDFLGQVIGTPEANRRSNRTNVLYWSYASAAVVLLLIALVFVVRQFNFSDSTTPKQQESYQEITTVRGQRTNLKLSDGSKVVLNSSSTLRIPENYGKGTRTLYLEGEAFFEVRHDEENPFLVVSHQTYTKDLGTQFNVTAYDSSSIEVAVREGLVSMGKVVEGSPQKEIVELTPGKLGVLKEVGGLTVSDVEYMDTHFGWAEGKLVFRNTPFQEVIERLERWYDIECEIKGPVNMLNKRTLTATYDGMPMSEVLKVLSVSMDVSYTRQGRDIIFNDTREKINH